MNEKLTPQQIENWRSVLVATVGPYAFIMPVEDIYKLRDKLQAAANQRVVE